METTQLDQDAVNLAKAIRQHESGGDFNAKGQSGESGGYQFTPNTWKAYAKEVLGNPDAPMTPQNQNQVAYTKIKQWKDSGKNVGQIASMWNAGEGKPNAYLENHVGVNKYGVKYDTPAYAKAVAENYQKLKQQTMQQTQQPQQTTQENPKKDFLQKAADVVNSIFPGKQVGEAIGTLGGYLLTPKEQKQYYDLSAPTPLQVAGDVAQGALTVAPGLGEVKAFGKTIPAIKTASSIAGRIGQSGLLGAGLGATQALKEGSTNVGDIYKKAKSGAITGGLLGSASEALSAVANHFPRTMIQGKFEGLSDAEANKFLKQNIGTQDSLLNQAQNVVKTEGGKIDSVLQSPKYASYVPKVNPFSDLLNQFPEYQGKEGKLVDKIKSFVSNTTNVGTDRKTILGYIDKIVNGEANLYEINQVRKVLDGSTKGGYAKLAKAIAPSAGHDLAMTFSDLLRNEVKGTASETIPMFDELQKSLNIRNVVRKVASKKGSTALIKYSDIIPFLGGNVLAPGIGGVGAVLANRAVENPATRFAGAKLSQGLLSGTSQLTKNPLLMKGVIGQ